MFGVAKGSGILAIALFSSLAQAQVDSAEFYEGDVGPPSNRNSVYVPGLSTGNVTYSGSGCPLGSARAVLSPDQRALSVLFDRYSLEVGGESGLRRSSVDCSIRVPFYVPAGYRARIVKIDYRGYTSVPPGARATFTAGLRFLDQSGRDLSNINRVARGKVFLGPKMQEFQLSSAVSGPQTSPCGQSFLLQADSHVLLQTNNFSEQVVTTVDSVDAAVPVEYALYWENCNNGGGRPPPRPGPPPGPRPPPTPQPPPSRPPPTPQCGPDTHLENGQCVANVRACVIRDRDSDEEVAGVQYWRTNEDGEMAWSKCQRPRRENDGD